MSRVNHWEKHWEDRQEVFIFRKLQLAFDVTKAMQLVGFPYAEPDAQVLVAPLIEEGVTVYAEHAAKADLSNPLILATIIPDYRVSIDGHHRAMKAYRKGILTLPTYVLTEEETSKVAVHWKHRLPDRERLEEIRDILTQLGLPANVSSLP